MVITVSFSAQQNGLGGEVAKTAAQLQYRQLADADIAETLKERRDLLVVVE